MLRFSTAFLALVSITITICIAASDAQAAHDVTRCIADCDAHYGECESKVKCTSRKVRCKDNCEMFEMESIVGSAEPIVENDKEFVLVDFISSFLGIPKDKFSTSITGVIYSQGTAEPDMESTAEPVENEFILHEVLGNILGAPVPPSK